MLLMASGSMGSLRLRAFNFALSWRLKVKQETGALHQRSFRLGTAEGSHHGPAFALLTLTGEIIRLSQSVVAVFRRIENVDVADEHLRQVRNTTQILHTSSFLDFTNSSPSSKNSLLISCCTPPTHTHSSSKRASAVIYPTTSKILSHRLNFKLYADDLLVFS